MSEMASVEEESGMEIYSHIQFNSDRCAIFLARFESIVLCRFDSILFQFIENRVAVGTCDRRTLPVEYSDYRYVAWTPVRLNIEL